MGKVGIPTIYGEDKIGNIHFAFKILYGMQFNTTIYPYSELTEIEKLKKQQILKKLKDSVV